MDENQWNLGKQLMEDIRILLANGTTPGEIKQAEQKYQIDGLQDTPWPKAYIYRFAVQQARDNNEGNEASLEDLARVLLLPTEEIEAVHQDVEIDAWTDGAIPILAPPPIPLHQREVAHFQFVGVQYGQERIVRRRHQGSSAGTSVRIAKGWWIRIGGHGSESWNESEIVHLGTGRLILTSKRIVFSSIDASFSIPFAKILNVTPADDGVAVVKDSTAANNKPFIFLLRVGARRMGAALAILSNRAKVG